MVEQQVPLRYQDRRKTEMLRFFGATMVTLVSCRLLMGKVAPKKVDSSLLRRTNFMSNHKPFTGTTSEKTGKDISMGLLYTTGMITGLISMGITGSCWNNDITTVDEFRERFRLDKEYLND
ncbi:uncharacterized protein GVI51_A04213 [Nakaseomyces glabratus]|uniref:Altered inheritance of mitochondria protein 11 n=1 Tax=Candida glabrata (strain ATCC 2001 / BCRC 20586 / JCM 3761 / NBRC 0622 / NRRL Y-65 / CBS 138) TaxID=284593 RepID=Q6FXT2_CANGA|nr:uncharacterized protein CAGL0A04367g [Nakaseomyces glabratus]KAH7609412.1 hypothetical protein J7293_00188 [Nakaseomyces glabratus]KAH7610285.1 hypothetical protein J7294_00188 [Nakaseomyces glabratus]OXB45453.1 hypothetical protein B1J91_A04367g [Nakaseomyces glabratus]OXB50750.1 hypothetical protein B1J92_A04367g [Nakaseomyces glabratus]QHS64575.1 uncharacterized protein GVI51_A04213 [Nakaseomyces glabratus]|eukprot:XP_444957.1 uncharacterized protein CAGL0A04367g [[Candida] glabrata]